LSDLHVLSASAKVIRVEVTSRTDVLNGQAFSGAGSYERIVGRVYFSVSVANAHNRRIVDLDKAVNLKDGGSNFLRIRCGPPEGPEQGQWLLAVGVPNRGRARIIGIVDGGSWDLANDAGDAWLLRNGYTVVSLGWQWDATGKDALRFYAPIARENGKTISGLLRGDLMPGKRWTKSARPSNHRRNRWHEYPVAAPTIP